MQNGTTPLFMAAQNGHLNVVEILIAAGAKVDLAKDVSLDSLEQTCNLSPSFVTTILFMSLFLHVKIW